MKTPNKTSHFKALSRTIIILCIVLVTQISFISALEIDNIKTYDEINKVVTLKNSFLGVPTTTIGTVKLETPIHNYILDDGDRKTKELIIEYTINLNSDSYTDFFKEIEFYKSNYANEGASFTTEYKQKVLTETKSVNDYEMVCSETGVIGNDSKEVKCIEKLTGSHLENIYEYQPIDLKTINKGEITIGVFADVEADGYIYEFIPTIAGVKVTEWAEFEGLTRYEYYVNNDETYYLSTTTRRGGNLFRVGLLGANVSFNLKMIELKLYKSGTVSGAKVIISATSSALPDDSNILGMNTTWNADGITTDSGGAWYNITFDPANQVSTQKGVTYAWYINNTIGGTIYYRTDGAGGSYPLPYVDDTGGGWTSGDSAPRNLFAIWGSIPLNDTAPIVTLNEPADYFNSSISAITFNCSGEDENVIENLTMYIDTVVNYTLIWGSSNYTSMEQNLNVADGAHTWSCRAYDNSSLTAIVNRNFYVDTIDPIVNIIYPANSTEFLITSAPYEIFINTTIVEAGDLKNCWASNETDNITRTCNTNQSINYSSSGWKTVFYYANDTLAHIGSDSTTFLINAIEYATNYTNPVIEGQGGTFYFNVSGDDLTGGVTANITYNNTVYPLTLIIENTTLAQFNISITTPMVSSDELKQFYYTFTAKGNSYQTINYTQLIYNIPSLIVAGTCDNKTLQFNLFDELNFTALMGTFNYNFKYGYSNNTASETYGQLTNTTFHLCVNLSIADTFYLGEGEIFYTAPGWANRRYYTFENLSLTSTVQNISLYDIEDSVQTSFQLVIEDNSLNPFSDYFTHLNRYYPELNSYKTVDVGKTDEKGETVIHVETEDVDYRIGVYSKTGTLIKLADPIRLVCLTSPCTYTMKISPTEVDYINFLNVAYTFDFNGTTNIWDFVYSDNSGDTESMNLTIYRTTGTSNYIICSNRLDSYSGALSCNTTGYSGNLRGVVFRTASPSIPIASLIKNVGNTAFKSAFGLWLSILISIPIIFVFALVSPVIALIGGVISLIPALYFGSINIAIIGGFAVLSGIIAHFLKRIN